MPDYSHQQYIIYHLPKIMAVDTDGWEEKQLGVLVDVVGGGTPDTNVPEYWNPLTIPWVTPTDISACDGPFLTRTERSISEAGLRSCSAIRLPPGTTLLTSRATVGECRMNTVEVTTNQGFASLVPREIVDGDFLFYMIQRIKPVFCRLAAGTTYAEVSRREVRKVYCFLPDDFDEQNQIANVLRLADNVIEDLKEQLCAARRLKTALMQQLFTKGMPGKHTKYRDVMLGRRTYTMPAGWSVKQIREVLTESPFNGVSPQSRPDPPGTPILNVTCIFEERATLDMSPMWISTMLHWVSARQEKVISTFCAEMEIVNTWGQEAG